MRRSEALKHDEKAEPDLLSIERRSLPESPAEPQLTGAAEGRTNALGMRADRRRESLECLRPCREGI
jgi:hypothetical protein